MNRHRYIKINRLIPKRDFSVKKKTLFKSASYVSEENMLVYFFMMFYKDEALEAMGRAEAQMGHGDFQIHLADCLPNLNLVFLRLHKRKADTLSGCSFFKRTFLNVRRFIFNIGKISAGKKEKFCCVCLEKFDIIKQSILKLKSRLVESNVQNDYLRLLDFLDHKSKQCFYFIKTFLKFYFPYYFKSIKKSQYQMTRLMSGFSRTIKNLAGSCSRQIRDPDLSGKTGKCVIWVMAFLLLIGPASGFAENARYASAFVWRGDGGGDYNLPKIASESSYVSQPVLISKGVVNSMTLVWAFEGVVTMEASADGGSHYTPVINGVPLKKDFVQGTNLKWRAAIGKESSLSEVRLVYADSSGLLGGFGEPQLSGFKYRKEFFVKGQGAEALYNYQVVIRLGESRDSKDADLHCDGHAAGDFHDVRFTLSDGETLAPFYLEKITGPQGARTAEFIVKVPQIPSSQIPLYVYYGNISADNLSDAKKTFDFYDDFQSQKLDQDVWDEILSLGGSAETAPDGLTLDAASVTSKTFHFRGGVIEFSATPLTGHEARLIIRLGDAQPGTDKSQVVYSSTYSGAEHCIAVGDIVKANEPNAIAQQTRYNYRVKVLGDEITFERYDQAFKEKEASVTYIDERGLQSGLIGLRSSGTNRGENATVFHWIRIKKCVEPEPVVDVKMTRDEENTALPYFNGIVLSPKGDLVVKDGFKEGTYITPVTYALFDARIIAPDWKGEGARVDITADNGKSARNDCDNYGYYYAAEDDFGMGKELKARAALQGADAVLKELNLQYAAGSITVLSPNGGEIWNAGSQKPITWTAWDYDKTYPMKIEYSLDNGKNYTVITASAKNDGKYNWRIPVDENLLTKEAKIRISDSRDPSVSDVCDKVFWIVPAPLQYGESGSSSGMASHAAQVNADNSRAEEQYQEAIEQETSSQQTRIVDLNRLISQNQHAGAVLYDVVLKIDDPALFKTDKKGIQEGELVVVVPAGNNWSETERNSLLILPVYLTEEELEGLNKQAEEVFTEKKDSSGDQIKETVIRKYKVNLESLGLTGGMKKIERGKKNIKNINAALKEKHPKEGILKGNLK